MTDLSAIETVVIAPISQILPFVSAVGFASGAVSGILGVAINRWQGQPSMSRRSLVSVLLGFSLIGMLLLTVTTLFTWNADPTKSLTALRQECFILVPALFVVPVSNLFSKASLKRLSRYNLLQMLSPK